MNSQHTLSPKTRAALAALFSAVALAACGGGDSTTEPPPPPPPPAPVDTPFATPDSATTTAEAGAIETYSFAEKAGEQTTTDVVYDAGTVSAGSTLAGDQAYAGLGLRYYAPGNTVGGTATPFDATGFTKMKITLASTTDGTLNIKLQPNPVSADGCTATATALVSATATEVEINLDSTSFPLPSYCTSGTTVDAVKAGLYAIDIVNAGTTAGDHDMKVGAVAFVE